MKSQIQNAEIARY